MKFTPPGFIVLSFLTSLAFCGIGYGILERLLGTDLRTHTNVILLFNDSGIHSKGGLQATTRIDGINNQPKTMVEFYTDSIVTNPVAQASAKPSSMK